MRYFNGAESINCGDYYHDEKAGVCEAVFYDAAMNLSFMVRASEGMKMLNWR